MATAIMYVSQDTIQLFTTKTTSKTSIHLLWGDSLQLQEILPATGRVKVKARGRTGYVNQDHISNKALLEYYFIDVGQGDGVLIVTPDRKHILIDCGYIRRNPTQRSVPLRKIILSLSAITNTPVSMHRDSFPIQSNSTLTSPINKQPSPFLF